MTIKARALALTVFLLAGCGAGPTQRLAPQPAAVGPMAARGDDSALADFLKSDPTFQASGTHNAFKVAAQDDFNPYVVQMWYRDLSGYFHDATEIQAVFGSGDHDHAPFQTFTLTKLQEGFYQMNFSQPANRVHNAVVAFHAGDKWDSNMGQNYGVHFQAFPTHPW